MALTKADVEQVVDFAIDLVNKGVAITKWTWDDVVVSWVLGPGGRDGLVRLACRMLGIAIERGAAPAGAEPAPLVMLTRAGTDELKGAGFDDQLKGKSVEWLQLLQFILALLRPWFPVPTT